MIQPSALLEGLPGTEIVHQAPPVRVPARSSEAGVESTTLSLKAPGGQLDASKISRATLGQDPGEERISIYIYIYIYIYLQLSKLLLAGAPPVR